MQDIAGYCLPEESWRTAESIILKSVLLTLLILGIIMLLPLGFTFMFHSKFQKHPFQLNAAAFLAEATLYCVVLTVLVITIFPSLTEDIWQPGPRLEWLSPFNRSSNNISRHLCQFQMHCFALHSCINGFICYDFY